MTASWKEEFTFRERDLMIPKESARPKMDGVVLELKFTDRFPNWMETLCGFSIFNEHPFQNT